MKPIKTWILVADGARARVLLNDGPGRGLRPAMNRELKTELPPNREVYADRPGSKATPGAGGRHGVAPKVDWQQFEKKRFAASVARILNNAARRGDFDRLVLVAPPAPLGTLRAQLEPLAREKVIGELGKDLTALDERKLVRRLSDVIVL